MKICKKHSSHIVYTSTHCPACVEIGLLKEKRYTSEQAFAAILKMFPAITAEFDKNKFRLAVLRQRMGGPPVFVSLDAAVNILQCSKGTIYKLIRTGMLGYIRAHRNKTFVLREDIVDHIIKINRDTTLNRAEISSLISENESKDPQSYT